MCSREIDRLVGPRARGQLQEPPKIFVEEAACADSPIVVHDDRTTIKGTLFDKAFFVRLRLAIRIQTLSD
jgi:hypothetical protein